jgi:hypothetical protein
LAARNAVPKKRIARARFDKLGKQCESVGKMLAETAPDLDEHQKASLAAALTRANRLAARLGIDAPL